MTSYRGKVKDFLNWNSALLTGKEADYSGRSMYWLDRLTGTGTDGAADRTAAAAHDRGWQGFLGDKLAAEGAASGWNSRGYMDTTTLQRHQFDPAKPFLKISDLRGGSTDAPVQGHQYDSATAMSLADTNAKNYGSNQSVYDNYNDLNLSTPHYKAMGGESSTPYQYVDADTAAANAAANTDTANTDTANTGALTTNDLDSWWAALDKPWLTNNTASNTSDFDQFTKFLTALSGMSGLFGGGGGQGYGVGGVASANPYMSNMSNFSNAFKHAQNKNPLQTTSSINI